MVMGMDMQPALAQRPAKVSACPSEVLSKAGALLATILEAMC